MLRTPARRDPLAVFAGGECGALARSVDWASTPLGPPESWSPALLTTLGILFSSRHPMFLWWGPELVQFYNDAYMPSFGAGKHPKAMGQSGKACWPEIWDIISPQIRDVMERGIASWYEDQLVPIHRNGRIEEVYWSYGYSPVYETDGSIGGTLAVCTETTSAVVERRAVAEAHAEAEHGRRRLLDLIHGAPAFVCTLRGPDHVFEIANLPYQRLVGTDRVLVGKAVKVALPEVVSQGFVKLLDRVFATGEPLLGDELGVRFDRRGDGELDEAFVNFVYQPYRGSSGAIEGIDVFGFEVTDQVRARNSAQREGAEWRVLAEAIPQQVWTATKEGALDFVNERVLEYFQAPREAVLGAGWQAVLHPDDVETTLAAWAHSLKTGELYQVEFRLRRHDGSYRWHLGRAVALRDGEARLVRWFGTNTDIDELKRVREELERRTEFEQHLLGIVSHDLRNPLNVIALGASALSQFEELNERSAKTVSRIQSAARRGTRMIHDLLDFTQARLGGGLPVHCAPADIHAIAGQVVDELIASQPERTLRLVQEGEGGGSWDADRIAQALANLLSNAIQYGDRDRPVTVNTRGAVDSVLIEIHNHGPAIPPESHATLFEPLKRVEEQIGKTSRSIGLGLFIVKEIITSHRGTIAVRSAEGEGTTFEIRLPRSF